MLLSPLLAALLLLVLLWLGKRYLPRWLRGIAFGLLALAYLLVTPLLAEPLLHALESRASGPCRTPLPQTVVVLSGGTDEDVRTSDYAALNQARIRRLIGGVSLWRTLGPRAQLVLSGGARNGARPESLLMTSMADELGIPAAAIRSE